MGKKHDMYIKYSKSYKNNNRQDKNGPWFTVLIILILLGLLLAAYFIIRNRIHSNQNQDIVPRSQSVTQTPSIPPTVSPTVTVPPTVTPTVTVPPVKAVTNDNVVNQAPSTVKGIYVTALAAGSDSMRRLLQIADKTEINAMVIDVKDDHGRISYEMNCKLAEEIKATSHTIGDMKELIKTLKEKNIYPIARIVAFKDPYLADKRPNLAIKNKDGSLYRDNNGEAWVNPYKKEVWDYLVDVASQAAQAGFDEVQFDYIRFSTGKGITNADFGEKAKVMSRQEVITAFTKYAYEKLKPLGVNLSADVYGTIIKSSVDAKLVGQDYVNMARHLDYICPMVYPSHFGEGNFGIVYPDLEPYKIINKVLTASKEKLSQIPKGEHRAVVRPWLQDFTATWIKHHMTYTGHELRQQIKGVYSAGYGEWLLWNSGCNYSEDGLFKE